MISPEVHRRALVSFLEPLQPLLDDATVSEVLINGPFQIFVERGGRLTRTKARFSSRASLDAALRNIAQYAGRPLDSEHPILEGHLPDGSRVQAMIPPASPDGPTVAIRRFSRDRLTIARLIDGGALTADAADFLSELVSAKRNIVVAGGTGSGKTSLLNALSSFVPPDERIVVLEDVRELDLAGDHVVRLLASGGDRRGRGRLTIRELFKASLRLRPDRIVVGEIRGEEAVDLVQAMTSGHGGCLSTLHATHPIDSLRRLETMALMSGLELPLAALRAQVASAIDVIVQTARFRDGKRGVTDIVEVVGTDDGGDYQLSELFTRGPSGTGNLVRPGGAGPRGAPEGAGVRSSGATRVRVAERSSSP
jgi:pilus assembly protein CpaF